MIVFQPKPLLTDAPKVVVFYCLCVPNHCYQFVSNRRWGAQEFSKYAFINRNSAAVDRMPRKARGCPLFGVLCIGK